ncbi:MAG: hypothetical protein ACFCGT_26165 [Sandaracinaceae bacterium]
MELAGEIDALRAALADVAREWEPEEPPLTLSMSKIGRAVAEERVPSGEVARVFAEVERVLREGSARERDAVATGFLEAVVAVVDESPRAEWLLAHAGPLARAYIDQWNEFWGVPKRFA